MSPLFFFIFANSTKAQTIANVIFIPRLHNLFKMYKSQDTRGNKMLLYISQPLHLYPNNLCTFFEPMHNFLQRVYIVLKKIFLIGDTDFEEIDFQNLSIKKEEKRKVKSKKDQWIRKSSIHSSKRKQTHTRDQQREPPRVG